MYECESWTVEKAERRGAWQAAVHGIAKTRLGDRTTTAALRCCVSLHCAAKKVNSVYVCISPVSFPLGRNSGVPPAWPVPSVLSPLWGVGGGE